MNTYDAAIIDDDSTSRIIIEGIIKSVNLSCKSFDSVKNFLNDKDSSFRCIVSDILMPETSGLELLEIFAKNDVEIPIILVTGFANVETARQAFKGGAIDFIQKPVEPNELIKVIQGSLDRSLKTREPYPDSLKDKINNLTKREKVVLSFLIEGQNNKEIAKKLSISVRTVETHRLRLLKKLHIDSVQKLLSIMKK